ncbi:MAG: family N-acetyltransferase [Candidatus Thermoplasmatota archaeon]|nr:family N-acetyltransferase [Candidatus Thermoplasmatota archaeon]
MSADGELQGCRSRVVLVKGPEGALSVELVPLREGVSRGFRNHSPRGLKLSPASARELSAKLSEGCGDRLLIADTKKRIIARALEPEGWRVSRAVEARIDNKCSMCTTYDIPVDCELVDDHGAKPDLDGTSDMVGVSMEIGGRPAYGFYTDDGDTARIVSEGPRRQGMLIAESVDDMEAAADCLVRFLATAKKKWAVFSLDLGRFVRRYDPIVMWRMALEGPRGFDHSVKPVSKANRKDAVRLFSEYYDEGGFQASMRLREMLSNKTYSVFVTDGGFVATKLDGETGLVYDIYVTPARQGEGVGGELMRCALSNLAGRAGVVYLHTSYPRAKALYEKFGFRTTYSQLAVRLDEMSFAPPPR